MCALMVLCLSATLSCLAVAADSTKATFTSPQHSAAIKLTKDGASIPAKDIHGWQLLASGHDYKYMLSREKMRLTTSTGRGVIQIDLPAVYDEGQTLELTMSVGAGRASA